MDYYFDENHIEPCHFVNDIDIDIDSLLHFDKHKDRIVPRLILILDYYLEALFWEILHVLRQAYITYIRPLLECASNVCSPHLIMHINSLERAQRHFTKRIIELQERLTVLNLETAEYRRLSCDLTMYYKVFHNPTPWLSMWYFNIIVPPFNLHSKATVSN